MYYFAFYLVLIFLSDELQRNLSVSDTGKSSYHLYTSHVNGHAIQIDDYTDVKTETYQLNMFCYRNMSLHLLYHR